MNRINFIEKFLDSLAIDSFISAYLIGANYQEINSFESLYKTLEKANFFDSGFLDHYQAAKYLLKQDSSFEMSLSLAKESGYNLESIDSMKLAELLYFYNISKQLADCKKDIENFFSDLINFENEASKLNGKTFETIYRSYSIQYDVIRMKLCANTNINTCVSVLVCIDIDTDFSLDENLQSLYEEIERYEQLEA